MMCPKCFSDNIEALDNKLTSFLPYREYECGDCGEVFEDTLTDYQDDDREWGDSDESDESE